MRSSVSEAQWRVSFREGEKKVPGSSGRKEERIQTRFMSFVNLSSSDVVWLTEFSSFVKMSRKEKDERRQSKKRVAMPPEKVGRKSLQAQDKFESCSFYRAFSSACEFLHCAIYIKRQVQEKSLIMVYIHYFFFPLLVATSRHPPLRNIKENSSSGVRVKNFF